MEIRKTLSNHTAITILYKSRILLGFNLGSGYHQASTLDLSIANASNGQSSLAIGGIAANWGF